MVEVRTTDGDSGKEVKTMWDTVQESAREACLTRDLPCQHCGHAAHTYLVCGDDCACQTVAMPGASLSA